MSRRKFLTLSVLMAVASLTGSQAAIWNMSLDQDLLKSFAPKGSGQSQLISEYQQAGPFTGKLFVDKGSLTVDELSSIKADMFTAGYTPVTETLLNDPSIKASSAILAAEWLQESGQTEEYADKAVHELATFFSLPGANDGAMQIDPLGLVRALTTGSQRPSAQNALANQGIDIWSSPRPYQHESARKIWELAEKHSGKAYFIGEDLFRYVNESAVKRDIAVASIISIVLNAAVFLIFIRNWYFLGIFFTGSAVSWLFLCVALRCCFSEIFPIVFGFASTFFSFNSEYLVHLCGIRSDRKTIVKRGMVSAVGTTLIGLCVLLASSSPLIQQMAVAAIAGLVGFFVGTVPFAPLLSSIKINAEIGRHNLSPVTTLNRRLTAWLKSVFGRVRHWAVFAGIGLAMVLVYGHPKISTDIGQFRFAPQLLLDTETHFMNLAPKDSNAYAVHTDDLAALGRDFEAGIAKSLGHLASDSPHEILAVTKFSASVVKKLNALGFDLAPELFSDAYHLDLTPSAPKLAEAAASLAGTVQLANGTWTVITLPNKIANQWTLDGKPIQKIDPKSYYNALLTTYAREMMLLFVLGFVAMIAYLAVIQRSARKVLLIMMPLLIFFLVGSMTLSFFGIALNIIHVIGLVLVIGFALDYTAIAVTADFDDIEMSKILITGVSTIASFAGLCLASHPFLQMLGFVVVPGVCVSLFFALVIDRAKAKSFLNRQLRWPGQQKSLVSLLVFFAPFLISGCQTPKSLMSTKTQRYSHPHFFVAEQSICINAKLKKVCFIGELQRSDETFSLTVMEPSMLTVLLAVESSAAHSVTTLVKATDDFMMRLDLVAILDVIRQLHLDSQPVMESGSLVMKTTNAHEWNVEYVWGNIDSPTCQYPVSLDLRFPATPSTPALLLEIKNTKVTCERSRPEKKP